MSYPVATIQRGIELAAAHQSYRVYICNATYAQAVTVLGKTQTPSEQSKVTEGVSLIGGLTCAQFQWAHAPGTHATIAPANGIPLTIREPTRAMIVEDLEILGNDSSQGAAIVYSTPDAGSPALVRFSRCILSAKPGQNGSALGTGNTFPDASAFVGNDAVGTAGGTARTCNQCGTGITIGGAGGGANVGGGAGVPPPPVGGTGGNAGCTNGGAGDAGAVGAVGGSATTLGTFYPVRWEPRAGDQGGTGLLGGGGGGGGGIAGGGGSGGCGGCGGRGGGGGQGGGASFAIGVAWSNVSISGGALYATDAGNGATGGPGHDGMPGGPGGMGSGGGCAGGNGGKGGTGGPGGLGAPGVSAGVIWTGVRPTIDPSTTIEHGSAGSGSMPGQAGQLVEVR
jgi:hypothetical protein